MASAGPLNTGSGLSPHGRNATAAWIRSPAARQQHRWPAHAPVRAWRTRQALRPPADRGDGHGAPVDLLAESDSLTYLAHALDAPVERLGARAPERPTWICSVRSDPCRPDLTDSQWAAVAHRLVAATGITPVGDPDACRRIALRNQPRQVQVVATLPREDGGLHNAYRDAFRLQTECHRIGVELGRLPTAPRPLLSTGCCSIPGTWFGLCQSVSGRPCQSRHTTKESSAAGPEPRCPSSSCSIVLGTWEAGSRRVLVIALANAR